MRPSPAPSAALLAACAALAACAPASPPRELAPDERALAAWACAAPDAPVPARGREVRHGGVRFQVPAGMVQQSRSPADVYEWEYTFTRGPRRLLVRLARREAWVGPLIGAQCEVEVAGRMAEVRVRTRNSNLERYTAMLKWRAVYPGADLYVEAVAPDLEGLEELRRVFWTFQLPDRRQAERDRGPGSAGAANVLRVSTIRLSRPDGHWPHTESTEELQPVLR